MEKTDQLVRLNIGAVPDELDITDWVLMVGDLLYMLIRSNGEVSYVYVPLDFHLLRSVQDSGTREEDGLYRDIRGEPTPLATYLVLVFLDRKVPVSAIRRELGIDEVTMKRLLEVWKGVDGGIDRKHMLRLLRLLAFDGYR
ncbi:hypothetical protein NOV72_04233 [Caballeronia novacaledonica]|uniref:Uncharacterized protein n=1 Tax=Caballeronia novacaledonica TaxID=1544861 RepID=A0A2U3IA91_9BURK|nr:hypothetical protein [Caballeronia novacaledonica]SPB17032.1 hypothetical protein NOV72_04233 [Caballeronia novacaledonica]